MKLISFLRFNPRHVMFFRVLVIILIIVLIVPKMFFLVKEIFSPYFLEEEGPADTQKVDKVTAYQESGSGFGENFWHNLRYFYLNGINNFV
ncbi:MAG: hypothetical protein D5R97_06205 [Candidatus Syntrophonatronum acetioxidans]|uniref:Uncharacterized protein n=1 Tax=Candidatus Syntrophonatronum acetioxidans TaxID=1795816 RepID=A0A424YDP6_9FIRM|nr:MAG: hypothetical protein D5R97_06205 [Candidatus Syntrophonatronum acetioxidans]